MYGWVAPVFLQFVAMIYRSNAEMMKQKKKDGLPQSRQVEVATKKRVQFSSAQILLSQPGTPSASLGFLKFHPRIMKPYEPAVSEILFIEGPRPTGELHHQVLRVTASPSADSNPGDYIGDNVRRDFSVPIRHSVHDSARQYRKRNLG